MYFNNIRDETHLDELLSEPDPGVIATLGRVEGDLVVLGVAGKMGPTLARMARRASDAAGVRRRIYGVARFSRPELAGWLLDPDAVAGLPEAPNVVAMLGQKFGTTGQAELTWAINCLPPAWIGRKYRASRIVAFSTGNVYPLTPITGTGSRESDPPGPIGEYAMSALCRERIYEYVSNCFHIPMVLIRLNYATEMRYGVPVDLARKVCEGQPIDLAMGAFNTIWQGDANAQALRAFEQVAVPPRVLNITGPEVLMVRAVAERLGQLMNRSVTLTGTEAPDALLSDASLAAKLFGPPRVSTDQLLRWVADWVARGGTSLGKPTHFEVRDGAF
jgi:dTDP-4-dehydrorhamnose reductase